MIPKKVENLIGNVYGNLTVIQFAYIKNLKTYWSCRCSCTGTKIGRSDMLKNGKTNSCGCKIFEHKSTSSRTNGSRENQLYVTWQCMRQRCNNPNYTDYCNYGGRGIKVCERWNDFVNFQKDMGIRPEGYTLDRKDNNEDYCPENCIWSDRKTQNRNKRTNHYITMDGQTKTVVEWAEITNIPAAVIYARINKLGWDSENAIKAPIGTRKKSLNQTITKLVK